MGNVFYVVFLIYVLYGIDSKVVNYFYVFIIVVIIEIVYEKILIVSKGMVMIVIDVLCNFELMVKIKKDFEEYLKVD